MTIYSYVYLGCFIVLLAFELVAIAKHNRQTISHHVWHWRNARNTKVRRVLLGLGSLWLAYHFFYDGPEPQPDVIVVPGIDQGIG